MAPKSNGGYYYAVRKGRIPGIYRSWSECEQQIKAFSGAVYRKFATQSEAEAFLLGVSSSSNENATTSTSADASSLKDTTSKKRNFGPQVEDVTGWDIVYSDGACKGNGQTGSYAGVGVWWGPNDPRNIAERCPGDQTNNRAELIAILRVLETTPKTKTPLLIRTDSQYAIQCFRDWIHTWIKRDWKNSTGEPVKNDGIIRCISAHLDIRGKMGQKVVLEYVKGHSGDIGNDGADLMANQGAIKPRVDERPWKQIERELEQQLLKISGDLRTSVTVLAPDNLADLDGEPEVQVPETPLKMRKLSPKPPTPKSVPSSKFNVAPGENSLKDIDESTTVTSQDESSSRVEPLLPLAPGEEPILTSSLNAKKGKPRSSSPQEDGSMIPAQFQTTLPTTSGMIISYPHLSGVQSPLRVLCARPPLVPVKAEDVNLDEYADCLLDDPSYDLSD